MTVHASDVTWAQQIKNLPGISARSDFFNGANILLLLVSLDRKVANSSVKQNSRSSGSGGSGFSLSLSLSLSPSPSLSSCLSPIHSDEDPFFLFSVRISVSVEIRRKTGRGSQSNLFVVVRLQQKQTKMFISILGFIKAGFRARKFNSEDANFQKTLISRGLRDGSRARAVAFDSSDLGSNPARALAICTDCYCILPGRRAFTNNGIVPFYSLIIIII